MISLKQRIARDLHQQFCEWGFAGLGVEALRKGADVSIRTLYKHFPSREAMIVGALEHRDTAYFDWLQGGPTQGIDHILHPFLRLGDWLEMVSNTGCLFTNAMAEHPDSVAIAHVVKAHKARLEEVFHIRLAHIAPQQETGDIANTLFVLHEGMTVVAQLKGPKAATQQTLRAARTILAAGNIT